MNNKPEAVKSNGRKAASMVAAVVGALILISPMRAMAHDWDDGHSDRREQHARGNSWWAHQDRDGDYERWEHRRFDPDHDGDNDRRFPPYRQYGGGHGEAYRPYQYAGPRYAAPYANGYDSNLGNLYRGRSQSLYALESAQAQYNAAVARGDRKAAKHLANAIKGRERDLSREDAAIQAQGGYNGNFSPFSASGSAGSQTYLAPLSGLFNW